MSFRCDHCGHRDSEINSAGEIQRTLPLDTIWQELT
jgi:C4-type Zn-finger protein